MPLLNGRGDVIAGGGGMPGSLNRQPYPFATYGGGCWLDDDTILVSIPAPAPVEALLATWRPGAPAPTPLPDNRGANEFAAGGGRFIAWLSGFGCWGTLGHLPAAGTAGRLSVAPDGTIAYIPDRGYGYGLTLVDPDGVAHDIPGIVSYSEQTLGRGAAIWQGGAYGTPAPRPARANAQGIVVADLPDGERWLVYWSDGVGFIAQLDGAADGYIIGVTPTFFNHHARAVNGELWIAWSLTQGEAPADVGVQLVDRSQPRVALVPPPAPIPRFSFTHPVVVAVFKDPVGETTSPMEVVVNQYPQTLTRPAFVAEDSLDYQVGPLEGIYSESPDPTVSIGVAADYDTRLILAHDSASDWTLPAGLRAYDVPCVELYLNEAETLESSVTRWTRQVQQLVADWPGTIGVIPMFYCMGGAPPDELFTVDQVLAGLAHVSAIVNLSARITVILPFSYLRANGITGHVELQQAFANLLTEQSRVGLAALPPVTAAPEPPEPIEPPEPTPEPPDPEPQPPEPEEPTMLYIETKFDKSNPKLAVLKCEIVKNADSTESYKSVERAASTDAAINGTPFYCITPEGLDEWRPDPGGPWESFHRSGTTLVADRSGDGDVNAYVRFCVEVK